MASYDPTNPDIDLAANQLGKILAARGIDPASLAKDDDPHSRVTVIRRSIAYANQRLPRHYRAAVLDHPEVRAWVDQLVAGATGPIVPSVSHGPSLLLIGRTGIGKTHTAYAAMRDLAVTGVNARWTAASAADLYASLRPRHQVDSEAEFRRYANADVLIVDDLGAAKNTDWTEEVNFRLINHRYEDEKPTIFTSNVPPAQLGTALGDRVASRLTEMCQRVVMKGDDRRRAA